MRHTIVFVSSTAIGILGYFLIRKLRTPHLNPCPLGYLHIYVGSETGHTLALAECLASEAKKFSFTPQVISLEDFRPMDFTKHDYCVILCSTTADGLPPPNAKNFLKWLAKRSEDLRKLSYCVFGISKSIEHGCLSAEDIEASLDSLGATKLIRRGSAVEGSKEAFVQWTKEL